MTRLWRLWRWCWRFGEDDRLTQYHRVSWPTREPRPPIHLERGRSRLAALRELRKRTGK